MEASVFARAVYVVLTFCFSPSGELVCTPHVELQSPLGRRSKASTSLGDSVNMPWLSVARQS